MDSLLHKYKYTVVSRGFKYHYHFSAPQPDKPNILFIHGFPSVSADWFNQISYFRERGYGIIAPDTLGYGGTDKPEDTAAYAQTAIAQDLIDILDHENIVNVFVVGHDWGSKTTSVLANLHSERFLGFGFLSVGYAPPNTQLTYEQLREKAVETLGYENSGYWEFFSAPDANDVIAKHIESFWDLLYAKDPQLWITFLCPTGGIRAFLESDSRVERADFVPEKLYDLYKQAYSTESGFNGALNNYRTLLNGQAIEDDKKIPQDKYDIKKPVFFGGTAKDVVCVPALHEANTRRFCPNLTTEVFQTSHWVMLEAPDELNKAIEKWIGSAVKIVEW